MVIDLGSACNMIDTRRLIEKMTSKQINTNIINWTHNFLTFRKQE